MGTGSLPEVKSGWCVMLTPHPLLMPWSRKGRVIPLLPLWTVWPVQILNACTRAHFTFFTFYDTQCPETPTPSFVAFRDMNVGLMKMDLVSHVIITAFLQKVHSWAICLTAFWVVICSKETESLAKRSEDIKLHYTIDMRYVVNSWPNVRYANHYMSLMDRAFCPVSFQINFWNYESCTYLVYAIPKYCYSRNLGWSPTWCTNFLFIYV